MMGAADRWIEHVLGRLSSTLADVPDAERQDIIVLQFQAGDEDDDARRPFVDIAWNTAQHLRAEQAASTGDSERCEWLSSHYQRDRAVTVGSDEHDREGASLVRAWLEEIGLWYEDEDAEEAETDTDPAIWQAFMELTAELVQRLHRNGLLEREIGRDVPIFINSQLAGTEQLRDFNRRANPPAFHAQLHRWSARSLPE
jgi:hypothetical protein